MAEAVTVDVRPFPHLKNRQRLPNDFLRAIYCRSINNEFAFRWMNRDFVHGLGKLQPPPLTEAGARVARDLKDNGLALAHFTEFFDQALLDELTVAFNGYRDEFNRIQAERQAKLERQRAKGKVVEKDLGKGVFLDTVHKAHTFIPDDVVSTYLAAPEFAAIAAEYMEMVPRYVGTSFWHTKPTPDERVHSQVWHRDYNDRRLVKIFLYLNDVGRENGFFEYATGTHIHGPYGRTFDRIGSNGYRAYPDQAAVEAIVGKIPLVQLDMVQKSNLYGSSTPWHGKPSVVQCQAPAGTLIFADTFGLHRGGYVKQGHRDMIMSTYSTNFNVHKPHFAVTPEFAATLSPFMKMAFGVGRGSAQG
jgi:hypothetical protein